MTSNLYQYILEWESFFSLAYVYTKRIAVPIGIHMLMNGSVVLAQVIGGDSIKIARTSNIYIPFYILK